VAVDVAEITFEYQDQTWILVFDGQTTPYPILVDTRPDRHYGWHVKRDGERCHLSYTKKGDAGLWDLNEDDWYQETKGFSERLVWAMEQLTPKVYEAPKPVRFTKVKRL
jgi:hypothetical protein